MSRLVTPTPEIKAPDHTNGQVEFALLRQEVQYMREDLSEIKNDVRISATTFLTREQGIIMTNDWNDRFRAQEKRITAIYAYGGTILAAVTLTVLGALAKLILKI